MFYPLEKKKLFHGRPHYHFILDFIHNFNLFLFLLFFNELLHLLGPPQMPPNHGHNPAQGGPHLIHSGMQGMPGLHPQVSGTPPGMFMPG